MNQSITKVLVAGLAVLACGCSLGPQALEVSRGQYNEAMRTTRDEQLLLNLVRLRYRDTPTFLEVSSIASQFVIDQTTAVDGEINEGSTAVNPDVLNLGVGLSYSERPTISYSPLAGDKFVGQMLSPLNLETLILLTGSGWSADRVFRLTVQGLNGIDNARAASGPTPDLAPPFAEFAQISSRLRELQKQGKIEIGIESREATLSDPIPTDAVKASDLLAATKDGCRFRMQADGTYVLTKATQGSIMRIAPDAVGSPEVKELMKLLRLDPGRPQYDLVAADRVLPGTDGSFEAIQIAPRSLLGAMFYLSQAVEVPALHRRVGLVTITRDAEGNEFDWSQVVGDLIHVRSSVLRPLNPSVIVRYKGYYFYIDASDLSSKTTFGLLVQLFELQAGREAGASPVLTIPVGG